MFFFQFDYKKIAVIVLLVLLPLFSISLLKPGDKLWIFRPLTNVVGLTETIFITYTSAIENTTKTYINMIGINKENMALKKENAILKARILSYSEVVAENERLKSALEFQQRQDYSVNPAQVIGIDIFAERSTLRINKGNAHGVKKGNAVITQNAVVGYVLETFNKTSVVLVLTDRYAVIDAILQNSRARGIVEGSGVDSLILKYLQRSDEVNVGDTVVTSGLDNLFPKGLPIARVKNVSRKKSDISPYVELSPIVDVTRLDEVLVLSNINNQSLEAKLE